MNGLKPIVLLPARERVASELRKAILSKQIAAGEVLTLESVAEQLGVSATPVREAFQILSRDGLIRLKTNKGAVVLGMTRERLREHYQVHAALESEACILCCEGEADLGKIAHSVQSARSALEADNSARYGDFNQSFHYEIWKASGNEKLKSMLSELWNGLSMGVESTVSAYAQGSQREHEEILTALQARDAANASAAMRRHILRSLEDMLTRYS